jgi:hypothetical protein
MAILLTKEYHEPLFPDLSIAIILALTFALVIVRQILAQASLSTSRERLAQAQQIAQIGTWNWDVKHDVVEGSAGATRIAGPEQDAPSRALRCCMSVAIR